MKTAQFFSSANDVIREVDIGNCKALAFVNSFSAHYCFTNVFNVSRKLNSLFSCGFEYFHIYARAKDVGLLPSSAMWVSCRC